MSADRRRGACPALSAPMQTGDGLLARLSPVSGGLSPNQLMGLCESAARHGNGIVEVTARGSMQFRGLGETSARRFAAEVDRLGIAVRSGVPVETGPLAGMDRSEIADPTPLAEALRQAIAGAGLAGKLGPKVSVVVDGGGAVSMDAIAADVRLTAERHGDGPLWQLAIAGDADSASPVATVPPDAALSIALDLLQQIAGLGIEARGRDLLSTQRFRTLRSMLPPSVLPDISPSRGEISGFGGVASLAAPPMDETNAAGPISPLEGEMSGRTEGGVLAVFQTLPTPYECVIPLTNSRLALPLALPFGSTDAASLIALAKAAAACGVADIRPAPNRSLLPICRSSEDAQALRAVAEDLGFVTDPSDPRIRIAACPGAPACASGHIPARKIAARLAPLLADLDTEFSLHVSGCAKGCARQAAADVTIVGDENGAGLVVNGTAGQKPVAYSSETDLPRMVRERLAATRAGPGRAATPADAGAFEREAR
ncbi:MAG: precorrin-3B synthase [Rhizobiaceae bacterium]|nr:precorrin-3B synthase [Rhizobiaceae bacterium]